MHRVGLMHRVGQMPERSVGRWQRRRVGLVTCSDDYVLDDSNDPNCPAERRAYLGRIAHVACVLKGPVWLREKDLSVEAYEGLAYDAVDAIASSKGITWDGGKCEGIALPLPGETGRLFFNHPEFVCERNRVIAMESHAAACKVAIGWHFDSGNVGRVVDMAPLIDRVSLPVHDIDEAKRACRVYEAATKINAGLSLEAVVSPLFATDCKPGVKPLSESLDVLNGIYVELESLKIYQHHLGGISSVNLSSDHAINIDLKSLLSMKSGMKRDLEMVNVEYCRIMSL